MPTLDKIFVLGRKVPNRLPRVDHQVARLRDRRAIHKAVHEAAHAAAAGSLAWIASDGNSADDLLEEGVSIRTQIRGASRRTLGKLVLLEVPRLETLAPAQGLFSSVAWTDRPRHWLPLPELLEVITDPEAKDYLIGGMVDWPTRCLTLYRGDLSRLLVPLSLFRPTGEGVKPDPNDFEVIDNGQAIRLGAYEAVADAIFYEADPEFRKRLRARLLAEQKTFGASLRRLRLQKGLRQRDFRPLPEKTIARIENGVVQTPHGKTLAVIADRLGVEPEEIETY